MTTDNVLIRTSSKAEASEILLAARAAGASVKLIKRTTEGVGTVPGRGITHFVCVEYIVRSN